MTTAKYDVFCGGYTGDNFSKWGERMSIFLGSEGTYVRHSRPMTDLTKICSKTTFMKKSYHKEVIENTFHVLKCSKSLFRCIRFL